MKRNTLTTAVLAGLTGVAGMASVANAVNVNPDGLGQVLLYPYYTARGGNDTLISIVNTTDRGKAVKIRFIEALNSREVLDFNIYLSPFDVWTSAVTATEDGGGKMVTTDNTCTVPYFVGASDDGVGEQDFLNFEFTGGNFDGGPTGIERSASGYIEVIEMGTMEDTTTTPDTVPWAAKHSGGVPNDCGMLVDMWRDSTGDWDTTDPTIGFDTARGASGGVYGSGSIINVAEGTMFSYNATAIDAFWQDGSMSHTDPGSLAPDLASGDNVESNVFVNGTVESDTWFGGAAGVEALNANLTYEMLMNEYVIDEDLAGRSEWVLTFPTKRFHTDALKGYVAEGDPLEPFTQTWSLNADGSLNHACEALSFRVWDREETEPTDPVGDVIVSPPPPPESPDVFRLCRESNVVRFTVEGGTPDQTEILKEPLRDDALLGYTNFNLPGYVAGWVRFDLGSLPAAVGGGERQSQASDDGDAYVGLPVVGFWANTFTNGDVGGTLANYGGSFEHRGTRTITSATD